MAGDFGFSAVPDPTRKKGGWFGNFFGSKLFAAAVAILAVTVAVGGTLAVRHFLKNDTDTPLMEESDVPRYVEDIDSTEEVEKGDILIMGEYGGEQLQWRVLAVEKSRVLLITEKLIDCKRYHQTWDSVTWETCTLRSWMNHDFLHQAFSSEEKSKIALVTNQNPSNAEWGTPEGNDTQDKIFALSIDEVNQYFSSEQDRIGYATAYAQNKGVWVSEENGASIWWLRSPGVLSSYAALVSGSGSVGLDGFTVDFDEVGVRPALWLSL